MQYSVVTADQDCSTEMVKCHFIKTNAMCVFIIFALLLILCGSPIKVTGTISRAM